MKIMVGIGCDKHTSLQTVETALILALQQCGLALPNIVALASINKKKDELALLQLAAKHNKPFYFYPAQKLAQVKVPNPSATVQKYMGTPAVAEAAALLAAETDMQNLMIEKYKYLGTDGKNATISIAKIS